MKKIVVVTLLAFIGSAFSAIASDRAAITGTDQVIVDRSTRDKTLQDYTLLTRDSIQKAWTTPLDLAIPSALKGKVAVNYVVSRTGSLKSVNLIRSSGNAEMDKSLLLAIRSAAPFPQFPDEIKAESVMIRANFVVADLPTIPVTTVQHKIDSDNSPVASAPDKGETKYNWGVSAGTANKKEVETDKEPPAPAPPARKYHWGL